VPIALSRDLDIRLNTAVKRIKYYNGGVEVTAENLKSNSTVTHKGEKATFLSFRVDFSGNHGRGSASLEP
jgi:hypothetical protein